MRFPLPTIGYGLIALYLLLFAALVAWWQPRLGLPDELAHHPRERMVIGVITQIEQKETAISDLIPYSLYTLTVQAGMESFQNVGFQTPALGQAEVSLGDKVLMAVLDDNTGSYAYVIDPWRLTTLIILALVFFGLLSIVTGASGWRPLVGLFISFYVMIAFLVPSIAAGYNPLLITIASIAVIIPTTFLIGHGFYVKTVMSILATILTLTAASLLAAFAVASGKLTGIVHEEVLSLLATQDIPYSFPGLILAGMIISALGILDDVTISQASLTEQLYQTGKFKSSRSLYKKAMVVGKDHIVSVVNTLLLVYAGAMLPTFLLFSRFPRPMLALLNSEVVVLEVSAGLIGTSAMIAAVPITTLLTAIVLVKGKKDR
jgi:uncharacterized membrane protein